MLAAVFLVGKVAGRTAWNAVVWLGALDLLGRPLVMLFRVTEDEGAWGFLNLGALDAANIIMAACAVIGVSLLDSESFDQRSVNGSPELSSSPVLAQALPQAASAGLSAAERLQNIESLRAAGLITEAEYERKRAAVLDTI
jgi:hypothetical protein